MQKRFMITLGLSIGISTHVLAQDASVLEEVVVSAEKRDVSLQKTSIAIDVKEGEDLRREAKSRVDDILRGTVGVNLQQNGGANGMNLSIRGIISSAGDPPGGGMPGTSIPLVIDGVAQDRTEAIRGGTLDLARAEVMRGPQSTNVGASAMAGAVSLVTNDPIFEYEGMGKLEVGSYHLFSSEGVLNAPLADNLALRFAASTEKRDGYYSSNAGESDETNYRVKFRWQANDKLNVVVSANHQSVGGNGFATGVLIAKGVWVPRITATTDPNYVALNGCVVAGPPTYGATNANVYAQGQTKITSGGCTPAYQVYYNGTDYRTRKDAWNDGYPADEFPNNPFSITTTDTFSAKVGWDLPIGVLTVSPSYLKADTRSQGIARGGVGNQAAPATSWADQTTSQFETTLASRADSAFEWLGGLYYRYSNREQLYANAAYPGGTLSAYAVTDPTASIVCPVGGGAMCYSYSSTKYSRQTSYSGYGNVKYPILDSLRLLAGLRYTEDLKAIKPDIYGSVGNIGDANGPYSPFVYTPEISHKFHDLNYRAGVEYDVAKDIMAYAAASTGYRPGNLQYNYVSPTATIPAQTSVSYTPSYEMTQYTLGLKSRFLDNRLQFNVEAFHSVMTGQALGGIVIATVNGSTGSVGNNCGLTTAGIAISPASSPVRVGPNGDCVLFTGPNATADQKSVGVDFDINFLLTPIDRIDLSVERLTATYDSSVLVNGSEFVATPANLLAAITAIGATPTANAASNASALAAELNNNSLNYIEGSSLQLSPKWTINAGYQHSFTLPGGGRLTPKLNMVYKSEYYSGGDGVVQVLRRNSVTDPWVNLAYQPAHTVYNAFATWDSQDRKFSVTGYLKNATNEVVMTNYSSPYVTLDAPRTYGLNLQGRF